MATLTINDFIDSSSLQLNGAASVVDGLLRLTPDETWQAGSAFFNQALAIDTDTDFSTQFQFQLSGGDGANGADGFTFLLNGGGSNALGDAGSKLGYGGIAQSLAIEFDTYNWKEVNGNHVALLTNGNTSSHLSLGTPGFDLNGSGLLTAWIDYSGQTDELSVYLSETETRPTAALFEHTIDITSVLGENAYVGFSGGTGGLTNNQDIYNWEFESSEAGDEDSHDHNDHNHGDAGDEDRHDEGGTDAIAQTNTLDFDNFIDSSSLQLNGAASVVDGLLRLTPDETWQAGSAFFNQALAIDTDTDFSTQFQFQLSGGDGANGADGFTFLLNGGGSNALGDAGSKLGYGGIAQSLAIEFDTYNWKEVNGNHVALLTNGNTSSHLSLGTPGFDLNGSGLLTAWIDYSGQTDELSVYLSETETRPTAALFEHTIDITSVLGENAYVGFSGGTGGLTNNQDIYNWEFESSSGTGDVPDDDHNDGDQSADPSYHDELVVSGLVAPVSMVALPDGRMLILEKFGTIQITNPEASVPTTSTFLTIPNVDSQGERGLLDITLDPDFESNGHFYVLYSSAATNRLQVSRFTVGQDGHTDHAHTTTEQVVWQDSFTLTDTREFHQGGGLDFGPDGKIYISLGDRKQPGATQTLNNTAGKILRIDKDPSIRLTDNPFYGESNSKSKNEIWAYGLRNPFRARWDEPTGRFFIGDVGGNVQEVAREEINLGKAGANYGWPRHEGFSNEPQFTNPLFSYDHKDVDPFGGSIVGGMVYRGDQFPEELQGAYVFGDFVQGWIRYLRFDEAGNIIDADPTTAKVITQLPPKGYCKTVEKN